MTAAFRHCRRTLFAGIPSPRRARLRRRGRPFRYAGSLHKLTSGRDVPSEVTKRLEQAGFKAQLALDGVLAMQR